jgi:hypothetical protein
MRTGLIPVLQRRSGKIPDLGWRLPLRFVTTPVASQLTGLSTDKLREWTNRRALIPADVRPKQKGSPAKFSWQTILILRVAVLLRNRFNLELQAHKTSFASLRKELRTKSFIALWGQRLALNPDSAWRLLEDGAPVPQGDILLLQLDPHLIVLRDGFALPDPASARGQLDLFSLSSVHLTDLAPRTVQSKGSGRRRSA